PASADAHLCARRMPNSCNSGDGWAVGSAQPMEVRMTQARFLARSPLVLAPALLLAATLAAHAADPSATTDPGFVPNSGQINRGTAPAVPSTKEVPPIPSPEEARAALMRSEERR